MGAIKFEKPKTVTGYSDNTGAIHQDEISAREENFNEALIIFTEKRDLDFADFKYAIIHHSYDIQAFIAEIELIDQLLKGRLNNG